MVARLTDQQPAEVLRGRLQAVHLKSVIRADALVAPNGDSHQCTICLVDLGDPPLDGGGGRVWVSGRDIVCPGVGGPARGAGEPGLRSTTTRTTRRKSPRAHSWTTGTEVVTTGTTGTGGRIERTFRADSRPALMGLARLTPQGL